jgi:hypothetical protein
MVNSKHNIKFVPTKQVDILLDGEKIGDIRMDSKSYYSVEEWIGTIWYHIPIEHSTFWKRTLDQAQKEAKNRINKYYVK